LPEIRDISNGRTNPTINSPTREEISMKTRLATVKIGRGDNGRVVWTGDYVYPETWVEADAMDGHEKAFKTYLSERYTNFLDGKRRASVSNAIPTALKAKIKAVWHSKDTEKLEQLAELLDLTMDELGLIAE
jgi:hypothetical protein